MHDVITNILSGIPNVEEPIFQIRPNKSLMIKLMQFECKLNGMHKQTHDFHS